MKWFKVDYRDNIGGWIFQTEKFNPTDFITVKTTIAIAGQTIIYNEILHFFENGITWRELTPQEVNKYKLELL